MKRPLSLDALERLGWRFGLGTITALLSELGDPHLSLRCAHVAGSNGKGSTSAFLAKFLRGSGYRTGLYTSPHLCDIRERFRIDGTWIPQEDLERHTRLVLDACEKVQEKLGHLPTHFEALTAIAFGWFKEQKVDWVVLEVGLGGRLDATNVIPFSGVSLIAPITLEHQDILGKTLPKIAFEKAGILKPYGIAATVQYHPEAAGILDQVAKEKGGTLWREGRDFHFRKRPDGFDWEGPGLGKRFRVPALAGYQVVNAALAVAGIQALRSQGVRGNAVDIRKALSTMRWPGRSEVVGRKPLVFLDGAHNPGAALMLRVFLEDRYPGKEWIVLNGFLKDKDHLGFLRTLAPLTAFSVITEPSAGRAQDGRKVWRDAWKKAGIPCGLQRDWRKALGVALREARKKRLPLLVTGSLYLVGDVRKELMGRRGLERI